MSLCLLATVVGVHGIQGWMKVKIYSDRENRFSYLNSVLIGNDEMNATRHSIESSKERTGFPIIKIATVNDRTTAESMVGMNIYITDEQMLPPPEGMHFVHDLIGCIIVDAKSSESRGKVRDVLLLPANDVYVVDYKDREVLIPAISEFVHEIDITKKRIIVKSIPGLFTDESDED